jgi:AraC-like DNA-binding protein
MKPVCPYATFRPYRQPSQGIPVGARSVGHHLVPPGWQDNIFTLNHICILWTISGWGNVIVNGRKRRCPENHLGIYLPGMEQNIYTTSSEWEYCWWTMDGAEAVRMLAGYGLKAGVHRAGSPPLSHIKQLQEQILLADREGEIDAGATALMLMAAVAKAVRYTVHQDEESPLITDARILINDNWQHPDFGVEQIAIILKVDRSTLSRRFHKEVGVTVIQYLISLRIQNAMTLLRQSELPVAAVAMRCGYSDPGYFRRIFRTRTGLTPSEFRDREAV